MLRLLKPVRRALFVALPALALGAVPASAQYPASSAKNERAFKTLPADEDWSFLADPAKRADAWDPLKYIPLRAGMKDWYVSIGGQVRESWIRTVDDNWGLQPTNNHFFNQRYMLHFDARFGPHLRAFVDFKSGINTGRIGGPRSIDEKRFDFASAFVEAAAGEAWGRARLRVGRHELQYGAGRLVDVREGPNVRQSFDGFVAKERMGSWQLDQFLVRPIADNPGYFDDGPIHGQGFWGIYTTRSLPAKAGLDLYYLGLDRPKAAFLRGSARETRHSVGARFFRPVALDEPGWDFDYEVVEQFGKFGSAEIQAWTFASENGYRVPTIALKPRFSLKADISSGDTPGSKTMGTFNALYPKGNYFGVLIGAGPGPVNFIDVHPRVEADLTHGLCASVDWIFQWRENVNDGVYSVPGVLIQRPNGSRARYVGHRPGGELRWQANPHLWFQADYGVFYAGRFLKEAGPGKDIDYASLYAGYKF